MIDWLKELKKKIVDPNVSDQEICKRRKRERTPHANEVSAL